MRRPGRIDETVSFGYATQEIADRILNDFCEQTCPIHDKLTTSQLINEIIFPNINDFDAIKKLCATYREPVDELMVVPVDAPVNEIMDVPVDVSVNAPVVEPATASELDQLRDQLVRA